MEFGKKVILSNGDNHKKKLLLMISQLPKIVNILQTKVPLLLAEDEKSILNCEINYFSF